MGNIYSVIKIFKYQAILHSTTISSHNAPSPIVGSYAIPHASSICDVDIGFIVMS